MATEDEKKQGPERTVRTYMAADLVNLVSRVLAQEVGMRLPVEQLADWKWSPGRGPVLTLELVRHRGVAHLEDRRK